MENIYADFVLRFEYRISLGGISRTFLRNNEKGPSVTQEIEIQLLNDQSGAIVGKIEWWDLQHGFTKAGGILPGRRLECYRSFLPGSPWYGWF